MKYGRSKHEKFTVAYIQHPKFAFFMRNVGRLEFRFLRSTQKVQVFLQHSLTNFLNSFTNPDE